MKLPESTEWVLHCVTTLAQLAPGDAASAGRLARYYDVPSTYLAKQLQHLVRAGLLTATTGPRGGFRLARPAADISLLDVVEAVDGASPPYVCQEIRQRGTGALPADQCRDRCPLAASMDTAHAAWRASLRGVTVGDVVDGLPKTAAPRTRRLIAQA